MWFDKGNQAFPGHNLIHLDEKALAAGLLTFTRVLGIGEGHLFHQGSSVKGVGVFCQIRKPFSEFP
ncbi:Uncharacterized protein AC505_3653 [Pseudomonas syringae pv. maculicola]|nr:Uncharacterized protein AC505_3653 [Pseudomonas syringae pv. maculicola]